MATEHARAVILRDLAAAFPAANVSAATYRAYEDHLADLAPDLLKAAIARLVQSARYFPSIGEIRESARVIVPDGHVDPESIWREIAGQLNRPRSHVELKGSQRVVVEDRPSFSDPLILAAVEGAMGSWDALCAAPIEDRVANRARIIAAYQALVRRTREREQMGLAVKRLIDAAVASKDRALSASPPAPMPPTAKPAGPTQLAHAIATQVAQARVEQLDHWEALGAISDVQREVRGYQVTTGVQWTQEQRGRIETELSAWRGKLDRGEITEHEYRAHKARLFGGAGTAP